jgi:hypothetical protein
LFTSVIISPCGWLVIQYYLGIKTRIRELGVVAMESESRDTRKASRPKFEQAKRIANAV